MGMDAGSFGKGARAAINATPLIDVVLVLLIIFMVLTPSMNKHLTAAIPRQAPASEVRVEPGAPIVVGYTASRDLTVDDQPVAFEALAGRVADRLRSSTDRVVFFAIEDEASYGEAIKLMDVVRGAGAARLAIMPPK